MPKNVPQNIADIIVHYNPENIPRHAWEKNTECYENTVSNYLCE